MADYELYLIVLLCMGAIILSASVCIWMILSTSKFGKEYRLFPILWEAKKAATVPSPREPELKEAEAASALEAGEELAETILPQKLEISLEGP